MKQVTKNNKTNKKTSTHHNPKKKKNNHPKFGTSKLEKYFAEEFLDKLGVEYIWQYEAKDIGRFYDFFIVRANLIIEVDGGYW